MSDNQNIYNTYIGARYVPLILGEWDITKRYEPLSIVTYQGNSYTSRGNVPANISITDTNYWVLTGNYNAQVDYYRQEVLELKKETIANTTDIDTLQTDFAGLDGRLLLVEGDIPPLQTDVAQLKTEVGKNTTDILQIDQKVSDNTNNITAVNGRVDQTNTNVANLTTSVSTNTSDISSLRTRTSTLETKVSAIENKKNRYVVIGDSYVDSSTSWAKTLKTFLNVGDGDYYLNSRGGAGFAHKGGAQDSKNFLELLQETTPGVLDKNTITHIVVCGGANNYATTAQQIKTGAGGIQQFCAYCKQNYPKAKIYIGFIGMNMSQHDGLLKALKAYQECGEFGASYLNGVENILPSLTLLNEDRIHPNTLGDYQLTVGIANALTTGACSVNYNYELCGYKKSSNVYSVDVAFASYTNDNIKKLVSTGAFFNIEPVQITGDGSAKVPIGKLSTGSFIGGAFSQTHFTGMVYSVADGFITIGITLIVEKDEMFLSFYGINKAGSDFYKQSISKIGMGSMELTSIYL